MQQTGGSILPPGDSNQRSLDRRQNLLGAPFLQARCPATPLAEIIQLSTPHLGLTQHLNPLHPRRAQQERALDTDTIGGNAADCEGGIGAVAVDEQHDALEFLDTLAGAFFDFYMHANHIPGVKLRDFGVDWGIECF